MQYLYKYQISQINDWIVKKYLFKFFSLSFHSEIIQFNHKIFNRLLFFFFYLIGQFDPKIYYSISKKKKNGLVGLVLEICFHKKFLLDKEYYRNVYHNEKFH